ncbi:MAG: PDZ domain-containing protein, partial [bacterium]|nr:PDZ domain-containing protein [bacterium]
RRGWLGVRIQNVTPDMVDAIEGLTEAAGAMVTDVPEGPAADAGILAGDIILTFDGQDVADTGELVRIVGNSPVGKVVDVEVLRDGEMTNVAVTLGRREEAQGVEPEVEQEPEPPAPAEMQMLGLTLSELSQDLADEYSLPESEGLVITGIEPMSDAEAKGLLPGDVITEVGQQAVTTIDQFEERIEQAREAGRKSILLLVRRAGDPRFVALVLDDE